MRKLSSFFISFMLSVTLQASSAEDPSFETAFCHMRAAFTEAKDKPLHLVLGGLPTEEHLKTDAFVRVYVDRNPCDIATSRKESPLVQADFNTLALWEDLQKNFSGAFDVIYFDVSVTKFVTWDNAVLRAALGCLKSGGTLYVPEMVSANEGPGDNVTYLHTSYPFPPIVLPDPYNPKTQLPWTPREEGTGISYPIQGTCMRTVYSDGCWRYNPSRLYDTFLLGTSYQRVIASVAFTQGYKDYPEIGLSERAQKQPDPFGLFLEEFVYFTITRK